MDPPALEQAWYIVGPQNKYADYLTWAGNVQSLKDVWTIH